MIHVVTRRNKHLYAKQIEEHHRVRYDIYVKERRWMALDRLDQREVDQFDNDDAIYLLALQDGKVIGGTRFTPTICPHLMSEVFPYLASVRGLQRGPTIYEWTRIFVIPAKRGSGSTVLHSLLAAVMEYCLDEGITHLTVVMETWWLPRFLEIGWKVIPLGLPAQHEDMIITATMIEVSQEHLASTMAFKGIEGPLIVRHGLSPL